MAKTLSTFPAEAEIQRAGRYPWAKWFDGQVWHVEKGTEAEFMDGKADYYVTTKSFRSAVTQACKSWNKSGKRGKVRTVEVKEEGKEGLILQFLPSADAATSE